MPDRMSSSTPESRAARSPHLRAAAVGLVALMAVGSLALWIAIPLGWVWVASLVSSSSQPSFGPYMLIIVGIPLSMIAMGKLLGVLNRLYGQVTGTQSNVRVARPWLKSMRGERDNTRPLTVLDVVMVCSVSAAVVVFLVWFFLFAGSSLPTS